MTRNYTDEASWSRLAVREKDSSRWALCEADPACADPSLRLPRRRPPPPEARALGGPRRGGVARRSAAAALRRRSGALCSERSVFFRRARISAALVLYLADTERLDSCSSISQRGLARRSTTARSPASRGLVSSPARLVVGLARSLFPPRPLSLSLSLSLSMPPPPNRGGRGQCCHDHDCGEAACGLQFDLYRAVDTARLRCENARTGAEQARHLFRPWAERAWSNALLGPPSKLLESHAGDPELLLVVPFTAAVSLAAIVVVGPPALGGGGDPPDGDAGSRSPLVLRLFPNPDETFSLEDAEALAQDNGGAPFEASLALDLAGSLEYPVPARRFAGLHSLALHFRGTQGGRPSDVRGLALSFVGLKGSQAPRRRQAVDAVYEARPVPDAHVRETDEKDAEHHRMDDDATAREGFGAGS